MTTVDTARDMDSIRQALGQSQITYYGFSYGTYLGQVYSTLFPSHVRRLIMDSNVDPRNVWYQANLDQDIAFNRNVKIWFGWLAQYHASTTWAGPRRRSRTASTRRRPGWPSTPSRARSARTSGPTFSWSAGYYEQTWLAVGQRVRELGQHAQQEGRRRRRSSLYQAVDTPGDDNGFAVYNAVQCTDVQWPTSWAVWSRDNHRVNKIAPFETWGNAWFNAPCLHWPAPPRERPRCRSTAAASAVPC